MLSMNKILTFSNEDIEFIYATLETDIPSPVEDAELKQDNCDLLHSNSINLYLDNIEAHKKVSQNKYSREAENFYLNLIMDHPLYPDAYNDLAELFANKKDPENSIAYYELYLQIVPFDYAAQVKLVQQRNLLNKLHPDNPPYPNADFKAALDLATQERPKENNYRKWYHIKIRKQLAPMHLPVTAPIMDATLGDNVDYTDPALSNGAVIYANRSNKATKAGNNFLAYFYNHKAIHRFKDDFLSITQRAYYLHIDVNDSLQALNELEKCIAKYNDALTYFWRHQIHLDLGENEKAKADLISFLTIGAKSDFDIIKQNAHRRILSILYDEAYTEYPYTLTNISGKETAQMTEKIAAAIKAIEAKRYQGNYLQEIESLTILLREEPTNEKYYAQRAFFYINKGEYDKANLNYSLALLFTKEITTHELYLGRLVVNLTIGNLPRARYDLNNAVYLYNDPNDRRPVLKLIEEVGKKCIAVTTLHLENGNFELAEIVSEIGLEKWQCTELIINYAIACGLQEKFETAFKILNNLRNHHSLDKIALATVERHIKYFSNAGMNAAVPEKNFEECKSSDDKYRRKRNKSRPVVFNQNPPKKASASTSHIQVLLKDSAKVKTEWDELIQEQEKKAQEDREDKERQRKTKEKMRAKTRKAKLRETRKNNSTHLEAQEEPLHCDEIDLDVNSLTSVTAPTKPKDEQILLELLDCEKAVFNLFAACKLQHPDQKFKSYIVGGWVYDRVREHLFKIAPMVKQSDIDTVTECPLDTLQAQLPTFRVVPQVRGLLQGIVFGYPVDIIHRPDLSSLSRDVRNRDFTCFYMDEEGRVTDPTGFGLIYMQQNLLRSIAPVSEVFKKDPLIILRAVCYSTKRNLKMADFRKQIKIDKSLLVPRIGDKENDTLLHPHRFNVLIKKNFSQQLALINYDLMSELGLIEILFPHIYVYLQQERDWMRAQMQMTDCVEWPKLEIIYANMIISAVMPQVDEKLNAFVKARLKETSRIFEGKLFLNAEGIAAIKTQTEAKLIEYFTANIIKQSLLFSDMIKLPLFVNKAVEQWKLFKTIKKPSSTKVTEAAKDTPEDNPELRARLSR
jgi:tRNA nucleotidyltransferase/poly(A) polymerase/tetratricopeptide (TPR) repeat protein